MTEETLTEKEKAFLSDMLLAAVYAEDEGVLGYGLEEDMNVMQSLADKGVITFEDEGYDLDERQDWYVVWLGDGVTLDDIRAAAKGGDHEQN